MLLSVQRVTKLYGAVIGVNELTLEVGPGVTGLIGANGAGKSTLLRLACGQLRPSQGTVRVAGFAATSQQARSQLGYSPDAGGMYEDMTGRQFVAWMARLHGFDRRQTQARTEEALAEVGMQDRASRRLAGASHGMRKRIKLAQALVHDPPILVLDEPLAGIDPAGRREIQDVLRRLADRGKAILVSSHILSELEQIADTVVVLARGRLVAQGSLAEIRGRLADRPHVVRVDTPDVHGLAARCIAKGVLASVEINGRSLVVRTTSMNGLLQEVALAAAQGEAAVERVEILDEGAEAVFAYLQQKTA